VLRRSLAAALLAAVAVALLLGVASVAQGQGGVSATAVPDDVVAASLGAPAADLSPIAAAVDAAREGSSGDALASDAGGAGRQSPCVVRADCAGALVLGGLGLMLALPVMTPSIGAGVVPTARVAGAARLLRSTVWATRLHRPPQPS
jgi:hypothetical protein